MQPRFCGNLFYVKLTTFFTAENIKLDTKITTNSESSLSMNMRSPGPVFEILPTSAVIYIHRVSHENETR